MNLTDALMQSHTQLRRIGEHLLTSDDTHHQSVFFEQLWQQFLVHEHAEEYIAFKVIEERAIDNPQFTEKSLDFAVNEHHYFEDFVEHIALLPEDNASRPTLIRELIEKLESHMQHEESDIFPQLANQLDDDQQQMMTTVYIDKCREFNKKYSPCLYQANNDTVSA